MMMPMLCVRVCSLDNVLVSDCMKFYSLVLWFFGALRACSGRKRRNVDAGDRERAAEFLFPMGHVARRAVAVEHSQGRIADVGELVEDAGRNVNGLSGRDHLPLVAQAHLARAFQNKIHFFLLLIVPRHLSAVRIEQDVADGEMRGLNGRGAAHHILRAASRRITTAFNLAQVGDNHVYFPPKTVPVV